MATIIVGGAATASQQFAVRWTETRKLHASEKTAREIMNIVNDGVIPIFANEKGWDTRNPPVILTINPNDVLVIKTWPYHHSEVREIVSMIDEYLTGRERWTMSDEDMIPYLVADLQFSMSRFGPVIQRDFLERCSNNVKNPALQRGFKSALAPGYKPPVYVRF